MQDRFLYRKQIIAAMSNDPAAWPKLLTDLVTTDVVESTQAPFGKYPFAISDKDISQLTELFGDRKKFKKTISQGSRGWARRDVNYINTTTPLDSVNLPTEVKLNLALQGITEIHQILVLTLDPQGYILPHSDSDRSGKTMYTYIPLREPTGVLFRFSDSGTLITQVGSAYYYDTTLPQHYVINASDDWRMVAIIHHNRIDLPVAPPLELVYPSQIAAIEHPDSEKTGAMFDVECEYELTVVDDTVTVTADHWPASIQMDGIWLCRELIHRHGVNTITSDNKKSMSVTVTRPISEWYIKKLQSFVLEQGLIDRKINVRKK
jgi:hypothetical protein